MIKLVKHILMISLFALYGHQAIAAAVSATSQSTPKNLGNEQAIPAAAAVAVGNSHNYDNGVPLSYTSKDGLMWAASTGQPPINSSSMGFLRGVACSSNGQLCTAVGYAHKSVPLIYTSKDGGVKWAASTIPASVDSFSQGLLYGVACSSNGKVCTAVGESNTGVGSHSKALIYTTSDGGITWTDSMSSPHGEPTKGVFYGVACSSNGKICTAVGSDILTPLISTSTDGGVTWVARTAPSYMSLLRGVACSSSGEICIVVGDNDIGNALIYTSTDSGVTWAASTPPPTLDGVDFGTGLSAVACSDNGKICTAVGGPRIYTTTDAGVTWTANKTLPPVRTYVDGFLVLTDPLLKGVTCSSNGKTCIAVGYEYSANQTRPISYTTTDGGVTWSANTTLPVDSSGGGLLYSVAMKKM